MPYFTDYVTRYTDLPFLVRLDPSADGEGYVPGTFLTAADPPGAEAGTEHAALLDIRAGALTQAPS